MKKILMLITALTVLMLCGCGSKNDTVTLNVYNWGEYISDGSEDTLDVNEEFEKYCLEELGKNVKVNYTTYASNEDMYNKIKSNSASYDVIIPSDYMIERMIDEDMLEKLDFNNIPNYEYVNEAFRGLFFDENDEYHDAAFVGMDVIHIHISAWSVLDSFQPCSNGTDSAS